MQIIQKTNSPYAAPVVIVRKKDGSNRVCIDFRKLNKVTVFDPEPMTSLEDVFSKLSGSKYFSKIDLSKGVLGYCVGNQEVCDILVWR